LYGLPGFKQSYPVVISAVLVLVVVACNARMVAIAGLGRSWCMRVIMRRAAAG
jgi:hypothetical protein